MITVKFDHSVKYNGIRYAAHEAFAVEDKDIDALKSAGATVLSAEEDLTSSAGNDENANAPTGEEAGDDTNGEGKEDVKLLKEALLDFTAPQLTAFAEENGIDLQGKTRKADIYNIIVAAIN